MGGGGAMRAATKVATYGINAGFRAIPLQEQSIPSAAAARWASRPVGAAIVSSSSSSTAADDVKTSLILTKNSNTDVSATVHKPSWEIDDWEFAGCEEDDFLLDSINPAPRVVFGGAPTLEEATEATSDLKEALEKEYFSISHSETKACITTENGLVNSSVPKPIFHAFSLLQQSPEAQSVVASIASDKNVWDAVMQNEKVLEYIRMQQQYSAPSDIDTNIEKPFQEDTSGTEECIKRSGNDFVKFVEKVKVKVTDIVGGLSGFFLNLFGGPTEGRITVDENGNATVKNTIGASFMALAVLAIMLAVLKRG